MGSITFIMLRVTSSIILLGAVATRAAPNPILPKTSALDFMRNPASVGDEEEMPEIPEDVPVPNCSPSAALLKIGQWRYVPNNGVSNTADVWFTVLPKMLTYQAGAAACQALDKNIQMASIMNSGENTAIKGMHGNGDKSTAKTWTCGYYDSASSKFYWSYGGKNTNEVMGYQSWNTGEGYPIYDPSARSRTDLRYTSNNWKDSVIDSAHEHPTLCQMRCKTNY